MPAMLPIDLRTCRFLCISVRTTCKFLCNSHAVDNFPSAYISFTFSPVFTASSQNDDLPSFLSPAALQSAAAALSLSSLSLSSSPPPVGPGVHISTSLAAASSNLGPPMIVSVKPEVRGGSTPTPSPFSDGSNIPSHYPSPDESKGSTTAPIPIGNGKQNKKRGVDHKCESCSKASPLS